MADFSNVSTTSGGEDLQRAADMQQSGGTLQGIFFKGSIPNMLQTVCKTLVQFKFVSGGSVIEVGVVGV